MKQLGEILRRRDWAYLLSLLVPLVCYDLILKVILIHDQTGFKSARGAFGLVRSDVLFNVGYAVFWIGLFALVRTGLPRRVVAILFHVVTLLVAVTATSAFVYFQKTGSTLDYGVISYGLAKWEEVQDIVASVVTPALLIGLALVLLYVTLGPWLITRFTARWWSPRGHTETPNISALAPLGIILIAVSLVGFSVPVSPGGEEGKAFARDAVVNVLASRVDYDQMRSKIPSTTNVSALQPPTNTRLVPTRHTQKKNIVLIHLESTRARSVTPYNPKIKTTPYLDKLARHSLIAENAYTEVPHTSKAIVSVNCGIYPHLTSKITEAQPGGIPARCLPKLLEKQGYNSVVFQSATGKFEDRAGTVKNFGYQQFFPLEKLPKKGFQKVNYFGREDNIMLKPSEQWIEKHKNKPFLMYYLGVTGHDNYLPIHRYGFKHYTDDKMLNRYLNDVNYSDHFVHNVIEMYKKLGLYKNTIFVIYGDHGEGFGEHGLYQHDDTIYQEGIKIPLIIHDPGRFQNGKRVTTLTNEMDILPTLMNLLGYKVVGGKYPGRSMLAPPDKNRTLYFSCWDDYNCLASLKGDKKYIYFFGNKPQEFYNIAKDPYERHDLAPEESKETLKKRRLDVLSWYSKINTLYKKKTPYYSK